MESSVLWFWGKTLFSALFIAGVSSLATRHPVLAGYLTALPLTTIMVVSMTYMQTGDASAATRYALAIFAALPLTLMFFAPFFLYDRLKGNFWLYMLAGLALLYLGSFVHRALAERWLGHG